MAENRFWDFTTALAGSEMAGLIIEKSVTVKMAPITATIRKSQQNRMAGGGSLLHTRSMPSKKRSTHDFFAAAVSVMFL